MQGFWTLNIHFHDLKSLTLGHRCLTLLGHLHSNSFLKNILLPVCAHAHCLSSDFHICLLEPWIHKRLPVALAIYQYRTLSLGIFNIKSRKKLQMTLEKIPQCFLSHIPRELWEIRLFLPCRIKSIEVSSKWRHPCNNAWPVPSKKGGRHTHFPWYFRPDIKVECSPLIRLPTMFPAKRYFQGILRN